MGSSSESDRTMFLRKNRVQQVEASAQPAKGQGSPTTQQKASGSPGSQSSPSSSPAASLRGSPPGSPSNRGPTRRSERGSDQGSVSQGDQDPEPEFKVAYYLFERESDGVTHLAFIGSNTVYVIDKARVLREGKIVTSSLIKGAPFKVVPSRVPWTSVVVFRDLLHESLDSFSVLQSQEVSSIPEVLCRITPSVNERQRTPSRNFQFMPDVIKAFNIQIPDVIVPETLVREGAIWARVKFTPKLVARKNGSMVRYPSVTKGNFKICDQYGEVIPRSPPTRAFSAATVAALKKGLGANLIVGGSPVSFSESGCLVVSDWALEDSGLDSSTSFEELIRAVAVQAEASAHQKGYFNAHFGLLSNRTRVDLSSRPTILFTPGFSSGLTYRMAETLALRAVRAGCRALVLASSSFASTDVNFGEINSSRANEIHTSTLYKINQPVQLGVYVGPAAPGGYDFENPNCSMNLFAYDIMEGGGGFSDSLKYPVVEVDLEGLPALDTSYLSNPKTKFALFVSATPAAVKVSCLKSKLLGSFSSDHDTTGRSSRIINLKAYLPSEKAREDIINHLKRFDGATSMKPEETNPSVSSHPRLITIKLLLDDLSFSHIVTFLAGMGCSLDGMFFLSSDTLRARLPPKDDLQSFAHKCRSVNRKLGKVFFRLLLGEGGTLNLEQSLSEDPSDPATLSFEVQGHTADLDAESVAAVVESTGGSNPRRIVGTCQSSLLVADWPQAPANGNYSGRSFRFVPYRVRAGDVSFPVTVDREAVLEELTGIPEGQYKVPLPGSYQEALEALPQEPQESEEQKGGSMGVEPSAADDGVPQADGDLSLPEGFFDEQPRRSSLEETQSLAPNQQVHQSQVPPSPQAGSPPIVVREPPTKGPEVVPGRQQEQGTPPPMFKGVSPSRQPECPVPQAVSPVKSPTPGDSQVCPESPDPKSNPPELPTVEEVNSWDEAKVREELVAAAIEFDGKAKLKALRRVLLIHLNLKRKNSKRSRASPGEQSPIKQNRGSLSQGKGGKQPGTIALPVGSPPFF